MWPQYILDQFSRVSRTDIANDHFGAYLSILAHECFSDSQTFAIHPQYPLPGAQDPGVSLDDYVVTFVVTVKDLPVFFLQIDAPRCYETLTDQRMHDRFRCLYNHGLIRIPKLYGISAVKESLAFYSLDGASGHVVALDQCTESPSPGSTEPSSPSDSDQDSIQDALVRSEWLVDINTEEGQQKLMSVIDEIKEMVLGSVIQKNSNKGHSLPSDIHQSTAQRSLVLSQVDTPMWPQYIYDQFSRVPHNTTLENHYLGVYLSILIRECFSNPQTFMVHPHYAYSVADDSHEFISYVVWVGDFPVFMIDIKPQSHLPFQTSRVIANEDMQTKRRVMLDFGKIKIHCVSAIGTKLSFYSVDPPARRLSPENVKRPEIGDLTDVIPESRWNVDITTQAGYQKFMAVVDDVKRAVEESREKKGSDAFLKGTPMRIRKRREIRERREREGLA